MATKQNSVSGDDKQNTTNAQDNLNENAPASAYPGDQTDANVRAGQVGEKVTTSFDERTGVTQPFVMPDGTQDNGLRNPEKAEGARAESTREGEATTVEETDKAIKEDIVEGPQRTVDDAAKDKPKNPVAQSPDTK